MRMDLRSNCLSWRDIVTWKARELLLRIYPNWVAWIYSRTNPKSHSVTTWVEDVKCLTDGSLWVPLDIMTPLDLNSVLDQLCNNAPDPSKTSPSPSLLIVEHK